MTSILIVAGHGGAERAEPDAMWLQGHEVADKGRVVADHGKGVAAGRDLQGEGQDFVSQRERELVGEADVFSHIRRSPKVGAASGDGISVDTGRPLFRSYGIKPPIGDAVLGSWGPLRAASERWAAVGPPNPGQPKMMVDGVLTYGDRNGPRSALAIDWEPGLAHVR